MKKAYYIFDGNNVVDVILGEDEKQQAEITLDLYKNEEGWLKPEIIVLDVIGEPNKGYNRLTTRIMNGKPCEAYLNFTPNYEDPESEYRIYNYKNSVIWV